MWSRWLIWVLPQKRKNTTYGEWSPAQNPVRTSSSFGSFHLAMLPTSTSIHAFFRPSIRCLCGFVWKCVKNLECQFESGDDNPVDLGLDFHAPSLRLSLHHMGLSWFIMVYLNPTIHWFIIIHPYPPSFAYFEGIPWYTTFSETLILLISIRLARLLTAIKEVKEDLEAVVAPILVALISHIHVLWETTSIRV